jgi:hypothetical protein
MHRAYKTTRVLYRRRRRTPRSRPSTKAAAARKFRLNRTLKLINNNWGTETPRVARTSKSASRCQLELSQRSSQQPPVAGTLILSTPSRAGTGDLLRERCERGSAAVGWIAGSAAESGVAVPPEDRRRLGLGNGGFHQASIARPGRSRLRNYGHGRRARTSRDPIRRSSR